MRVKQPTDYDQQICILREHGCIVDDEMLCKKQLSEVCYYRLSAFFVPFKNKDGKFKQDTTFEDIWHLYEFDRKMRSILLTAIGIIEISFRSKLSYYHSNKYGSLGYKNEGTFGKKHNHAEFQRRIMTEIDRHSRVAFVKHHINKYNREFPLWVAMELFSFGTLSLFYADMLTADQKEIASEVGINYNNLKSYLHCCANLRNICAHHERIYNRIFSCVPPQKEFCINEWEAQRLWGQLLVLRALFPSKNRWNTEIVCRVKELMKEYRRYIVLEHMAFPKGWLSKLEK